MRASIIIASAGLAMAAPTTTVVKRDGITDAQILNYALTLEHLEDTFYRTGLANFSADAFAHAGYHPRVRQQIETIAYDEKTHVAFLTAALSQAGANPVAECSYNFGVTDVNSFLTTASVLEGVGVSAYLGAAASIMNKDYLTAAGSILTVEARHSSFIRNSINQSPFPQPFDDPLTFNEVYSLAAQFITSCPSTNDPLPVMAFPVLTAMAYPKGAAIKSGCTLLLSTADWPKGAVYAAFITVTGPIFVDVKETKDGYVIVVPDGINGQSYVVLTSDNKSVTDDNILAGPAVVEVMNY